MFEEHIKFRKSSMSVEQEEPNGENCEIRQEIGLIQQSDLQFYKTTVAYCGVPV